MFPKTLSEEPDLSTEPTQEYQVHEDISSIRLKVVNFVKHLPRSEVINISSAINPSVGKLNEQMARAILSHHLLEMSDEYLQFAARNLGIHPS